LPIGYGQTISQPSLVLLMTSYLAPDKNSRVLEIGTGSGYQTALLAEFSKQVFTVERIKALADKGQQDLLPWAMRISNTGRVTAVSAGRSTRPMTGSWLLLRQIKRLSS